MIDKLAGSQCGPR